MSEVVAKAEEVAKEVEKTPAADEKEKEAEVDPNAPIEYVPRPDRSALDKSVESLNDEIAGLNDKLKAIDNKINAVRVSTPSRRLDCPHRRRRRRLTLFCLFPPLRRPRTRATARRTSSARPAR